MNSESRRSRKSHKPARWSAYRRIPQFIPVPVCNRRDRWNATRLAIVVLAATGSALEAARTGREIPARKVTPRELRVCALEGPVAVRLWRGRCAFFHRQPSNNALLRLVAIYGRPSRPFGERWR